MLLAALLRRYFLSLRYFFPSHRVGINLTEGLHRNVCLVLFDELRAHCRALSRAQKAHIKILARCIPAFDITFDCFDKVPALRRIDRSRDGCAQLSFSDYRCGMSSLDTSARATVTRSSWIERHFEEGNSRVRLVSCAPRGRCREKGNHSPPLTLSASQFSARPTAITPRKKLARKIKRGTRAVTS